MGALAGAWPLALPARRVLRGLRLLDSERREGRTGPQQGVEPRRERQARRGRGAARLGREGDSARAAPAGPVDPARADCDAAGRLGARADPRRRCGEQPGDVAPLAAGPGAARSEPSACGRSLRASERRPAGARADARGGPSELAGAPRVAGSSRARRGDRRGARRRFRERSGPASSAIGTCSLRRSGRESARSFAPTSGCSRRRARRSIARCPSARGGARRLRRAGARRLDRPDRAGRRELRSSRQPRRRDRDRRAGRRGGGDRPRSRPQTRHGPGRRLAATA